MQTLFACAGAAFMRHEMAFNVVAPAADTGGMASGVLAATGVAQD